MFRSNRTEYVRCRADKKKYPLHGAFRIMEYNQSVVLPLSTSVTCFPSVANPLPARLSFCLARRPTKDTFRLLLVSLLVELSNKGPPECKAKSRVCPQEFRSAETLPLPANTLAENRGSMQAERGTRTIGCRHPRLVRADLPEVHDGLWTDMNQHSAWWFR